MPGRVPRIPHPKPQEIPPTAVEGAVPPVPPATPPPAPVTPAPGEPPKPLTATEKMIQAGQQPPAGPLALHSTIDEVQGRLDAPVPLERPRSPYRNINIERTGTEEGINQLLDAVSLDTKNAGYEPKPLAETAAGAEQIPVKDSIRQMMRRKPGELMNDEQLTRARGIMVASAQHIQDWGKNLKARGIAQVTDAEMLDYQRALQRHSAIQYAVQGATRDVARTLNALRLTPDTLDPQVISEAMRSYGGSKEAIFQKALTIADAKTLDEASKAAGMVSGLRRAAENLVYYRTMGLLSGPRTHVVNAVSNSLVNMMAVSERFVTGVHSQAFGSGEVYPREAVEMFYGEMANLRDAFRLAAKAWNTGDSVYGGTKIETDAALSSTGLGLRQDNPAGMAYDLAASAISLPGRALTSSDEFFKTMAFSQQARALAYRIGRREGLKGEALNARIEEVLAAPNQEKILDSLSQQGLAGDELDMAFMAKLSEEERLFQGLYRESVDFARYQTFTDNVESTFGKALGDIHRGSPAARLIVPFYRTPANILSYAAERSPMFVAAPKFWENVRAGGAKRDEAMARAYLGGMIAVAAIAANAEGKLTGSGPPNYNLTKVYQKLGWKPQTLNGVSYGRLEPLATPIAVIADMTEAYRYATTDKQRENIMVVMTASLAETMGDKTMLTGLSDFLDAISAGQQGGNAAASYVTKLAASFLPYSSLQRSLRQQTDPQRRLTIGDGPLESGWNYIRNQIPIPALYDDLPPDVDFWGKPMASMDFIGPDMISPFYVAEYEDDAPTYALAENGVAPDFVSPEFSIPGTGVRIDLTKVDTGRGSAWTVHDYRVAVGEQRRAQVSALLAHPAYEKAVPGAPQPEPVIEAAEQSLLMGGFNNSVRLMPPTRGDLLRGAMSRGRQVANALFYQKYRDAIQTAMLQDMASGRVASPPPAMITEGRKAAVESRRKRIAEPRF